MSYDFAMDPQELKQRLGGGLLSFPVTDFDAQGAFAPGSYRARLEWLMPFGARALFAAGGTGEFFSLTHGEYGSVVRAAVETCRGQVPIIAGAGTGTASAIEFARAAESAGAQGILLMPHYLTEADQEGLGAHVQAVCRSVKLGIIVYNRANSRLSAATLERAAERCPNLIGFKDGVGDIEQMMSIRLRLGERLVYLGGLPTAEVFAPAYRAMGVPVYSSAVFNFIPAFAMRFYRALVEGEDPQVERMLRDFFMPYLAIRNRRAGYAVSVIKAGARIVGRPAGPVRPPLVDLTAEEEAQLASLIESVAVH